MDNDFMPFPADLAQAVQKKLDSQDTEMVKKEIREKSNAQAKRKLGVQPVAVPVAAPTATPIAAALGATLPTAGMAVPQPTVGLSSDPEAISLALPSNFHYYTGFKDVYCKPFRALHLSKLALAHSEVSLLPVVEAVSSVLSCSTGVPNLGFLLSSGDFYAVLYWLKFNSFTKSTMKHTALCKNHTHIEAVKAGTMAVESLRTEVIIPNGILKTSYLTKPLPTDTLPGFRLRPALMRDTVEYFEHPNWNRPDFQYLADLASVLEPLSNPNMSLYDKIVLVENMDGDQVSIVEEFSKNADTFGVEEVVNVTCNGCGASFESKISIDARSFLSIK